jgi:hypothetical protein
MVSVVEVPESNAEDQTSVAVRRFPSSEKLPERLPVRVHFADLSVRPAVAIRFAPSSVPW